LPVGVREASAAGEVVELGEDNFFDTGLGTVPFNP
jgi:hypothetical protein